MPLRTRQPERRATITAVGHYLPERVMTNADFEKILDTSDEWIRTRTGISERRIMEEGASSDMAARAVQAMLARRGIDASEIDLIIVATVTPDMFFPATGCLVQDMVGASHAWAFDLSAACSGFLYALVVGAQFIESGAHEKVVVVGTDKMSSIIDYSDRTTSILFGDAAAAVLLEPAGDPSEGILDFILRVDGKGKDALHMRAGGSRCPASHDTVDKRLHYVYQDGKTVFKAAVVGMADVSAEIVERNGLTGRDVDWLVPHQANLRIIDATAERMGLTKDKVMVNIDRFGNTTAATIPLCLSEWWEAGRLRKGQTIVLASFGAGYTWGSILVKWTADDAPAGR